MSEIKFVGAKHFNKLAGRRVRTIVIHDMEYPERPTGAEWCADFFAGRNGLTAPRASAHYCVDSDSVVQCVRDEDVAWHTPGKLPGGDYVNNYSIGIEHAGYAKQTEAEWSDDYSMAMLEISAELVARLCLEHGVPPIFRSEADLRAGLIDGITGHVHFTKATGTGSHWDPGPGFPWDWYMGRVRAAHSLLSGFADRERPPAVADDGTWVDVEHGGKTWRVSPIYVPFVGIGQAADLAESLGCVLPTPGLVRAIWEAADLKLDARQLIDGTHDGTIKTMASPAAFAAMGTRLARVVGERSLGKDYRLLAGAFKDVVRDENGVLGIYGWQDAAGRPIQDFYSRHVRGWIDYSQGLRLVKEAPAPE